MRVAFAVGLLALAACSRDKAPEPAAQQSTVSSPPVAATSASSAASSATSSVHLSDRITRPAAPRVVAIGDLHGDLDHARRAFRLAGAIGADDHWSGGALVVVQTGDEIDRGDDDRAILDTVERWKHEAAAAGGELIALVGNHELMNAALDFRYVTPAGFAAFADVKEQGQPALAPMSLPAEQRGRAFAFRPGGMYATMLASRPMFVKVGDAFFVHGGILPDALGAGLDSIDQGTRDWLLGNRAEAPSMATSDHGPVWSRAYSDPEHEDCASLAKVNAALGVKRMIVGHTVQKQGVSSACGRQVWRIDVGLSHVYGGPIQVLELRGDDIKTLSEAAGTSPSALSK